MDISNWPIGRILQLPEHFFGRKFPVSCATVMFDVAPAWAISQLALPERCVLWDLLFWEAWPEFYCTGWRVALGDQLPTVAAEFDVLEALLPRVGAERPGAYRLEAQVYSIIRLGPMKVPIAAAGRRLVCEFTGTEAKETQALVIGIFSSIPREIPDCLLSV